jgi:hypothetical protein
VHRRDDLAAGGDLAAEAGSGCGHETSSELVCVYPYMRKVLRTCMEKQPLNHIIFLLFCQYVMCQLTRFRKRLMYIQSYTLLPRKNAISA